jgi:hypothetical protein
LYEGGIRVPTLAWWPGQIKAGSVSDHVGYFGDFYATACEVTEQATPEGLDSISFLAALRGGQPQQHTYLYWEFHEQGSRQAVRFGSWKAIRAPMFSGKVELYDLSKDLGEEQNIAAEHPEVVQAVKYLDAAHVNDPLAVTPIFFATVDAVASTKLQHLAPCRIACSISARKEGTKHATVDAFASSVMRPHQRTCTSPARPNRRVKRQENGCISISL